MQHLVPFVVSSPGSPNCLIELHVSTLTPECLSIQRGLEGSTQKGGTQPQQSTELTEEHPQNIWGDMEMFNSCQKTPTVSSTLLYRESAILQPTNTLGPIDEGRYTLALRECYGEVEGEVVALEPSPSNFSFLLEQGDVLLESSFEDIAGANQETAPSSLIFDLFLVERFVQPEVQPDKGGALATETQAETNFSRAAQHSWVTIDGPDQHRLGVLAVGATFCAAVLLAAFSLYMLSWLQRMAPILRKRKARQVAKFSLPAETDSAPEHADLVDSGLPTAVDSESCSREPTPTRLFQQLPVGSVNIGGSGTEGGHLTSYW